MTETLLYQIAVDILLPIEKVNQIVKSAHRRYKVYEIKKRSGSGYRTIAQPAKEVKLLQYWVINNILNRFDTHPSATAYIKGKNIKDNARPHANYPYLLKLDIKNFFPSIKGDDFAQLIKSKNKIRLSEHDISILKNILFWIPKHQMEHQLSIGAPSSPMVSNIMMFEFDSLINEYCYNNNINYTRYADDMTFSMEVNEKRNETLDKVENILSSLPYPRLELNNKKTVFVSKANRRIVTGLILSNEGNVSLGRDRKRLISAMIHHFIIGKMNEEEKERDKLRGMIAFAQSVEPEFIARMEKRYGERAITEIKNDILRDIRK